MPKDPRGRKRITTNGFQFRYEDLIIETYGGLHDRLAIITHKPTGLVAEGHDPAYPGSRVGARKMALENLRVMYEAWEKEQRRLRWEQEEEDD